MKTRIDLAGMFAESGAAYIEFSPYEDEHGAYALVSFVYYAGEHPRDRYSWGTTVHADDDGIEQAKRAAEEHQRWTVKRALQSENKP